MPKPLDSQIRGYTNAPERMKKDPTFPIYQLGLVNGKLAVQKAALSYLEKKYIEDEDRPDRGSPEAKALLALAKDLAQFMREFKLEGLE